MGRSLFRPLLLATPASFDRGHYIDRPAKRSKVPCCSIGKIAWNFLTDNFAAYYTASSGKKLTLAERRTVHTGHTRIRMDDSVFFSGYAKARPLYFCFRPSANYEV